MASNTTHARDLKDEASDTLNQDYRVLRDNVAQLRSDVVELLSHAFGLGKNSMNAARHSVTEHAGDAMSMLKEEIAHLRKQGGNHVEAIGKRIEDNPVISTAVAFGIGFVLAKLLSRK